MSTQAVNKFLQKVGEDKELQQELTQALNSENQKQATVELVNKHGYKCSADELWTELKKVKNEFQAKLDSGEITEEQLETVAGGAGGVITAGLLTAGGAVAAALINKWL